MFGDISRGILPCKSTNKGEGALENTIIKIIVIFIICGVIFLLICAYVSNILDERDNK